MMIGDTTIVCLCGSTKFKEAFVRANAEESAKGKIVLTVAWFSHYDGSLGKNQETIFKRLHFRKIDLADELLILNVNGYIGSLTKEEIEYATKLGKQINYLEPLSI